MRSGRGCARAVQLGQSMAGGVHGCGVWGINPSATGCAHAKQTQAKRPTTACPLPTPSTQPGPTHQASPLLGWLRQRGGIQCARLLILPPHTLQQVAPVGQVAIVQPAPHGLEQLQLLHEPCGWSQRCGGGALLVGSAHGSNRAWLATCSGGRCPEDGAHRAGERAQPYLRWGPPAREQA